MMDDAKLEACFDRIDAFVTDAVGEIEPEQVVLMLISAAGYVADQSDMPLAQFLTMVRATVNEGYGVTIAGMAIDSPDFHTEGEA